jgi:hypothetical protein
MVDELLTAETLDNNFFQDRERERARIAMVHVRGTEDKFKTVLKVSGMPSDVLDSSISSPPQANFP